MFDLYFNHNGTGGQNPSGQFWQARPIVSNNGNGNTNKPEFLLAYPFENTKWSDANPNTNGEVLKLNQTKGHETVQSRTISAVDADWPAGLAVQPVHLRDGDVRQCSSAKDSAGSLSGSG